MRKILNFKYSIGSALELRVGDRKFLRFYNDPSKIVRMLFGEDAEDIEVPKFMGVYQYNRTVAETENSEEIKEAENIQRQIDRNKEKTLKFTDDIIFSSLGSRDCVNPNLIYVAYNSRKWDLEFIKKSLDDSLRRVTIGPVEKMPDFPRKSPDLLAETFNEIEANREMSRDFKEIIRPYIEETEKQFRLYGATRIEFALYSKLQRARATIKRDVPDK